MVDEIILEFNGLQIRQAQHYGDGAYQIIKRKMVECREFVALQEIHPAPVKKDAAEINHQAKRQELIFIPLPEVLIKITHIGPQQTNGYGIDPQDHKLPEIHPLSEIMIGKHVIIVVYL
jgi:hypothetical protein